MASSPTPAAAVILQGDEPDAWLDPERSIASFATRLDTAGTFGLDPVKGPKRSHLPRQG
jgi:hypothetical protein